MTSKGYALAREELVRALTAYTGITTADGAADGTTLVDSNLIGKNDFITEKTIIVMSGDAQYEDKGAALFNNVNGAITLQGTGFSAQIVAGTIYRILNISSVEIDVANIDTKIGTNTDAAGTTTLFARLKQIVDTYLADGTIGLANLKALIDALALEATLGTHDTDIKALLATIAGYLDTEVAAILAAVDTEVAAILEDTGTTIPGLLATIAGYLDTEVVAIKTQTDKIAGKMLFSMDFWSEPQEEIVMTAGQTTPGLPTVTITDLPGTATIVRAIAMLKFRVVENTNAAENSLDKTAAQPIQVRSDAPGTWRDAINFVDEQFKIAAETREGGDVLVGSIDIAVEVDENDGYNFQWLNAKAHLGNIQFNDVACGLRIWYSV